MTVQAPQALIDWLQFTVKGEHNEHTTIIHLLELDVNDFVLLDKGRLGYKQQLFYQGISVLFDGSTGMGIHVIMPGQACRSYESENDLIKLIQRVDKDQGKFTRIDLALDDYSGKYIRLSEIIYDVTQCNIVSKWKDNTQIVKRSNSNGELLGNTLNIGSRSSNVYLRIYDKAMEQQVPGPWIRLELEVKKTHAETLQKTLNGNNVGFIISEILNNYIRIIEPNPNDTNKSRWKTKEHWSRLLVTTQKLKLTKQPKERTIEETKLWIENQIAPTLGLIMVNDDWDFEFLKKQAMLGAKRLKNRHIKMLKGKKYDYLRSGKSE